MLQALGVNVPPAKARKYFARVDADGSGQIDFHELELALYAFTSGERDLRVAQLLHPRDAFEVGWWAGGGMWWAGGGRVR